jgi:glycosyltransferase A (GT-A) superfamily protein (DUF2064 family)
VQTCAIGIMAKAPQAGRSKTRLCPPLLAEQAAELSAAFLRDTTENIAAAARIVPVAGMVAYAPAGSESLFEGNVAAGTGFVLADGVAGFGDDTPAGASGSADGTPVGVTAFDWVPPSGVTGFGRCLLHAVDAMLAQGFRAACVLNSDSPTMPTRFLVDAARALLDSGDRIVLGPAEDGGYYLLGMKRPHARLFADIAWSTDSVADATRARARELGLEIVELPLWYDVDDRPSLARLLHEISGNGPPGTPERWLASATRSAVRRIGLVAPEQFRAAE